MAKPKGFDVYLREPDATAPTGYRRRRWRVSTARLPRNQFEKQLGYCCRKTRTIVIHSGLGQNDFLSTLVHEVLHASFPDLDEAPILRAEHNVAAVMTRVGKLLTEDA